MSVSWLSFAALLVTAPFLMAGDPAPARSPSITNRTSLAFPLRVSDNKRYLVDSSGKPFLIVGDTAWSLIAQLNRNEILEYLDDRQRRGFNAIIVNLIEHKFADRAPAKIDGVAPFRDMANFAEPVPEYFDDAHRAIEEANRRGISVWLCPAYLGWGGGDEGFFHKIRRAGPTALRAYGRYLGERFKDLSNIVWMPGGDYALPESDRWAGEEVASGLRDGGARQIMTAHGGQTTGVETFGDQPWLEVESVYRYQEDLWRPLQVAWLQRPVRPFVMIESAYEGEHQASPARIRAQAWWSVLCGAAGQFFGNNPIWYFDGPGFIDRKSAPTWRKALDLPGSRDMSRLAAFFSGWPWHTLEPDLQSELIVSGAGEDGMRITASRSRDGRLAIVYIPSEGRASREFVVDLRVFPSPPTVRWFNPAADAPLRSADTPDDQHHQHTFHTPGDNGAGANDWVLIMDARKF